MGSVEGRERLEFELLADELVLIKHKVILRTHLYLDHKCADGQEGGSLEIPVNIDLVNQLKTSFGIDPEFSPYERVELTNILAALEKLDLTVKELSSSIQEEIRLMDSDPDYFENEEDE